MQTNIKGCYLKLIKYRLLVGKKYKEYEASEIDES